MPTYFADSRLVDSNWSRLPFYRSTRLMALHFTRDHGVERAYVLDAPGHTWWLNGGSGPIHDANEAESLTLTDSTVAAYLRFFHYFVYGEEGGFVLIESADEVSPRADGAVNDGDPDQDPEEILTLEQARARARLVKAHSVDEEGRWLFDATVAYGGVMFGASLTVDASGLVDMT